MIEYNEKLVLEMLGEDAALVNGELEKIYPETSGIASVLYEAERYSLLAGGKRVRAALAIETCKMLGGDVEAAIPFAAAVEMIHTYSLIHDDLPCMDDDDMRRGKPTNHKVFGETIALLAGDSLLTGAFEAAASNRAVSAETAMKAVAYLSGCAGRYGMVGGQIMDLEGEKKTLTLEQLLKLHSMKTGALISAASVLGALAAGVSLTDPRMQDVVTYAENIGLAFQIVDDILDCTGNAEELGKNVGVDAEHQKNTFMSFYTVKEAQYYADRLTEEAVQALKKYPDSDILCSLAKWLATRKK